LSSRVGVVTVKTKFRVGSLYLLCGSFICIILYNSREF
jgi:hypothetical protein